MACTNQTVRFDGSNSTDADGAVNAFSWNFGDGSSGGGERPTHVFERPGTYTVTLTITGDARGACGALDTAETIVTVVEAPRVEIVGPDRAAAATPDPLPGAALTGEGDLARRPLRLGLRRRRHRHRPGTSPTRSPSRG